MYPMPLKTNGVQIVQIIYPYLQDKPCKGKFCVNEIYNPVHKSTIEGSRETISCLCGLFQIVLSMYRFSSSDYAVVCKRPREFLYIKL